MTQTVADFILPRLADWGITRIYRHTGDGINGIMGAMGRGADRFDHARARHEEMAAFMARDPKFAASQEVEDFSYARYAQEMLGFNGIRVDDPADLARAWEVAFACDRPVLLEIISARDVPPLPSHTTLVQAKAFTSNRRKAIRISSASSTRVCAI